MCPRNRNFNLFFRALSLSLSFFKTLALSFLSALIGGLKGVENPLMRTHFRETWRSPEAREEHSIAHIQPSPRPRLLSHPGKRRFSSSPCSFFLSFFFPIFPSFPLAVQSFRNITPSPLFLSRDRFHQRCAARPFQARGIFADENRLKDDAVRDASLSRLCSLWDDEMNFEGWWKMRKR